MTKSRKGGTMGMKESMDRFLKAMGINEKVQETAVLARWKEFVGEAAALRTENLRLNQRVLHAKIGSSVMREELFMRKQEILLKLNRAAGYLMVEEIFFE